jgi:5-methylthioribose kinase
MENRVSEALNDSDFNSSETLKLVIPEIEREEFIGYKRENLTYLRDKYGNLNIVFIMEDDHPDRFKIT